MLLSSGLSSENVDLLMLQQHRVPLKWSISKHWEAPKREERIYWEESCEPSDGEPGALDDPERAWCLPSCPHRYGSAFEHFSAASEPKGMLYCDSLICEHRCFHFKCVGLKARPRSERWFCPDCRNVESERPGWTYSKGELWTKSNPPLPRGGFDADWFDEGSHVWDPGTKPKRKAKGSFVYKGPVETPAFAKKQVVGYVGLIFMGRSTKTKGLAGTAKQFEPEHACPFCKCRKWCNQ